MVTSVAVSAAALAATVVVASSVAAVAARLPQRRAPPPSLPVMHLSLHPVDDTTLTLGTLATVVAAAAATGVVL